MNDRPEYLTTDEAAAIVRSSRDYVARLCASGQIVARKLGRDWRIHRDELDRFMRGTGKAKPVRERKRAS